VEERVRGDFLFFLTVHNVFLTTFPIPPQFLLPYCLAKAEIPCTYIWCERGRGGRNKEAYRFRLTCRGVPHVPKILVMVQSNGSFWEKKKKTMGVLH
jgi:hypothetical protein